MKNVSTKVMLLFLVVGAMFFAGCVASLLDAATKGDTKEMERLIAAGADVNAKDKDDNTSLGFAAENGHTDIVRFLIEKGADVNAKNKNDGTPLIFAVTQGHTDIARLLIEKGADVNAKSNDGNTPLLYAAIKGHTDIARLLIEKGADVNAKSKKNNTPLLNAAYYGHTDIARLLIEKGVDVNAKNMGGVTPLENAILTGHMDIARLLIEKGADVNVALAYFKNTPNAKNNLAGLVKERETVKQPTVVARPERPQQAEQASSIKSDVDALPSTKAKPNQNAYAIVIGIETYRQKLPKADFAAHDAQVMTEYLTKVMGYPEENVVTLINDRAAKSDMEKYFEKWLKNNVEKGGTVFIYYSGHGAPNPKTGDAFLAPYDADPAFIDETGYSIKRLYDALGKLPAKEIVVAMDSCFSGAGGRSVIAKGARPLVMNLDEEIRPLTRNMTVFSASSGDEISSTYDEKGHGLFTYFFLKGLKGEGDANGDGRIDTGELYSYLKPNVMRTARKVYNNEQSPQIFHPAAGKDVQLR